MISLGMSAVMVVMMVVIRHEYYVFFGHLLDRTFIFGDRTFIFGDRTFFGEKRDRISFL